MTNDNWKKLVRDMLPKPAAYWLRAKEYLTKTGTDWELVEAESDDYNAWVRYFRYLGFKPHMLTMIERKVIDKIAVPTSRPEWFDSSYVDHGELRTKPWQDIKTTPAMRAMARSWLDRSDPVAAQLICDEVNPQKYAVGERLNYKHFLAHAKAIGGSPRPVGAYEAGGYLGPSEINTKSKRKVYTEEEKAAFLEDAKRVGESIKGMKLSDAAKQTLR